jgi:hypothetical protein
MLDTGAPAREKKQINSTKCCGVICARGLEGPFQQRTANRYLRELSDRTAVDGSQDKEQ